MIAVLVPVHDEERLLGACLRSIAVAARHPGLRGETVEVVVALDRCTDASRAIALGHGAEIVELVDGNVGLARAAAAQAALLLGARWMAMTDADSTVPANWLVGQVERGADAFCGIVTVEDWQDYDTDTIVAFAGPHVPREGHRHVHGANLGVSADAYRRCGGFAALACSEDVALVDALERCGATIAWAAAPAVVTSARREARAVGGFSDYLKQLEVVVHQQRPEVVPLEAA